MSINPISNNSGDTFFREKVRENLQNGINGRVYSKKDYTSTLSPKEMRSVVKYALAGAGSGAFLGAGIGAIIAIPSGGSSIPIGMGIGGGIGLIIGTFTGIKIVRILNRNDYKSWKKDATEKDIEVVSKKIASYVTSQEFICPFTGEVAKDPVTTPYSPHKYERVEIEKWVKTNGTCPHTRQPLSLDQLRSSVRTMGGVLAITDNILEEQTQNADLSETQKDLILKIKTAVKEKTKAFFNVEATHLLSKVNNDEITYQEYSESIQLFADVIAADDVKHNKEKNDPNNNT